MRFINKVIRGSDVKKIMIECQNLCGKDATVWLIDSLKDLGFRYATKSGISMAISDAEIVPEKDKLVAEADVKVDEIEKNYQRGLITEAEKARLSEEVWS